MNGWTMPNSDSLSILTGSAVGILAGAGDGRGETVAGALAAGGGTESFETSGVVSDAVSLTLGAGGFL